MRRVAVAFVLLGTLPACVENTAPGNDREAELEPPARAAQVVAAGDATDGVATGLLMPEIMTTPDLASLPAVSDRCTFRMTRVGFPVFVYGTSTGVIKLNGALVALPADGEGRYSADGVDVVIRGLEPRPDGDAAFLAELVVRLPGAPNELGFHGFASC